MACVTTGLLLIPLFDPLCKVSSSAQSIYSLMSNITNYTSYPDMVIALKELDLEASIRVLEKFISELNIKNGTKTLEESLNLLKSCIINIENELIIVHDKMAYNSTVKYFSWFRTYKFTSSINKLIMLKKQLDNRSHMLFNIIKFNKNNDLIKNTYLCDDNINNMDISILEKI